MRVDVVLVLLVVGGWRNEDRGHAARLGRARERHSLLCYVSMRVCVYACVCACKQGVAWAYTDASCRVGNGGGMMIGREASKVSASPTPQSVSAALGARHGHRAGE